MKLHSVALISLLAACSANADHGSSGDPYGSDADGASVAETSDAYCQRSTSGAASCRCGLSTASLAGFTRTSACEVDGDYTRCCANPSARTAGAVTSCACYGRGYSGGGCIGGTVAVSDCLSQTYVTTSGSGTCGCQSDSECVGTCTRYFCDRTSGCGTCGCR